MDDAPATVEELQGLEVRQAKLLKGLFPPAHDGDGITGTVVQQAQRVPSGVIEPVKDGPSELREFMFHRSNGGLNE